MKNDDENTLPEILVGIALVILMLWLALYTKPANASEHCEGWAMQAEHIMQARQEHMTLEEITQRLSEASDIPAEAKPTFTKIIEAAYGVTMIHLTTHGEIEA